MAITRCGALPLYGNQEKMAFGEKIRCLVQFNLKEPLQQNYYTVLCVHAKTSVLLIALVSIVTDTYVDVKCNLVMLQFKT